MTRPCLLIATLAIVTPVVSAEPADSLAAHARAGWPLEVSRFARPSDIGRHTGYHLGGGCALLRKGDPRAPWEGTWGWDYIGSHFQRRVILNWWHGRRYQGGPGAYQTDGPHVLHPLEEGH